MQQRGGRNCQRGICRRDSNLSFLVRFRGASRTGMPLRTYSGVSLRVPSRHPARPASIVGVEDSGALDHLLLPHGELV